MRHRRIFKLALLNVVMPAPHQPQRYRALLQSAARLRTVVGLRGEYSGMLSLFDASDDVIQGELYRFFNLTPDDSWFDVRRQQEADESDIAKIRIPTHLRPHYHAFKFAFFPRPHRLAYVSREGKHTLSPPLAVKLLTAALNTRQLQETFGEVRVHAEPRREQLQRILQLPLLRKLRIEVSPPNPDDLDEAEQEVFRRMDFEKASDMLIELRASGESGLRPDADHSRIALVAQSNGKVVGTGRDADGARVELSTANTPLIESASYQPDRESLSGALVGAAQQLLRSLRRD